MNVQEASIYLAMEEAALAVLARERRIPCMEVDGSWTFSRKSLDKWRTQRGAPSA
jgi:hypothetical protein